MLKIIPLSNRVLISRTKPKESRGGILLPDSAQEKSREGTVLAVGPGKLNDQGVLETTQVKIGDRVMFGPYSGTEVKESDGSNNEQLLILAETEILGILS